MENSEIEERPICFENLKLEVLICKHKICKKCLSKILEGKPIINCPLCRSKIENVELKEKLINSIYSSLFDN